MTGMAEDLSVWSRMPIVEGHRLGSTPEATPRASPARHGLRPGQLGALALGGQRKYQAGRSVCRPRLDGRRCEARLATARWSRTGRAEPRLNLADLAGQRGGRGAAFGPLRLTPSAGWHQAIAQQLGLLAVMLPGQHW
jgi:hypothetical protein